ncbi:MAG: hypothetical protein V1833_05775 [Elusimicrobiota bacterium]
MFDKIVSIKYIGNLPVYDLSIEGTHNFVAEGIVAHNTSPNTGAPAKAGDIGVPKSTNNPKLALPVIGLLFTAVLPSKIIQLAPIIARVGELNENFKTVMYSDTDTSPITKPGIVHAVPPVSQQQGMNRIHTSITKEVPDESEIICKIVVPNVDQSGEKYVLVTVSAQMINGVLEMYCTPSIPVESSFEKQMSDLLNDAIRTELFEGRPEVCKLVEKLLRAKLGPTMTEVQENGITVFLKDNYCSESIIDDYNSGEYIGERAGQISNPEYVGAVRNALRTGSDAAIQKAIETAIREGSRESKTGPAVTDRVTRVMTTLQSSGLLSHINEFQSDSVLLDLTFTEIANFVNAEYDENTLLANVEILKEKYSNSSKKEKKKIEKFINKNKLWLDTQELTSDTGEIEDCKQIVGYTYYRFLKEMKQISKNNKDKELLFAFDMSLRSATGEEAISSIIAQAKCLLSYGFKGIKINLQKEDINIVFLSKLKEIKKIDPAFSIIAKVSEIYQDTVDELNKEGIYVVIGSDDKIGNITQPGKIVVEVTSKDIEEDNNIKSMILEIHPGFINLVMVGKEDDLYKLYCRIILLDEKLSGVKSRLDANYQIGKLLFGSSG